MKSMRKSVTRILMLAATAEALVLGVVVGRDGRSLARAADDGTAPVGTATTPKAEAGPGVVRLDAIDPDALIVVQRLLAIRGFNPGPVDGTVRPELDGALRAFAISQGIETASSGSTLSSTLDALGAGHEVAVRWGSNDPRAPELSSAECYRVNYALSARGYRDDGSIPSAIDATTVSALRRFQKDTGHPVQLGNFVARRWMFILGVATPESCPPTGTVPAGFHDGR